MRVGNSKAEIIAPVHALTFRLRELVKSPYVIGGLLIGAATAGYFAVARRDTRRARPSGLAANASRPSTTAATTEHLSLSSRGMACAITTPAPHRNDLQHLVPHRSGTEQKSAGAVAQGNWARQQWQTLNVTVEAWLDDFAPSMGAALSYYTLFSLAPLLIIVIAVAGMVFGQDAAQGEIVSQLREIMGDEGAVAVEALLTAAREPAKGVVATIVGLGVLLLGATAIFAELQNDLDRIWRVPAPKDELGIWRLLRTRLLSFGLVLGLGFLLVVSLVVSAALAALGKWWSEWFKGWEVLLEMLDFAVSLGTFTLLFAMIYKIMPRARISWRDVWTGAAVTALLFTIGKVLIGMYLGKSSLASGFGAAGALVLLLAWVYYSAQIFLFGAEYTWVCANRHESRARNALPDNSHTVPRRAGVAPH